MTGGALHLVAANGLAAAVAALAAWRLVPGSEAWRRLAAGLAAYGIAAAAAALGSVAFAGGSVLAAEGLLAAVGAILIVVPRRDRPAAAPGGAGERGARWRAAAAVFGALAGMWIAGSLFGPTRFGIDDFTYHAAIPARWLADGSAGLVPTTYQTYFPLHAEALSLWFLLPLRADAFASLGDLYGWLLVATGTYGVARGLSGSPAAALWAAAAASACRDLLARLGTFAQPDVVGAGAALCAVALAGPTPDGDGETRPGAALAAGAALGIAVGCKVTFGLAALGVVAYLASRSGWLRACLAAGAAAIVGGGWYVRDLLATGNPFYPAAVGPFGGPLDAAAQARTKLWTWLVASPDGSSPWPAVASKAWEWPAPLLLLAAVGIAAAVAAEARHRSAAPRGYLALVLALALGLVAAFPFLPFSGTFNRPYAGLEGIAGRYLLSPFALAVSLVVVLERRRAGRLAVADRLAAAALAASLPSIAAAALRGPELVAGAALGVAAGLAWRSLARPRVLALALALVVVAAAAALPSKQSRTDGALFATARGDLRPGEGWRALETLPEGARIAYFMPDPAEYTHAYPVFGRRLQHVPVAVERDGSPKPLLHERPPARWWEAWESLDAPLDPGALAANLARSGVGWVAVTRWTLGRWPPQREAIRAIPSARRVHADDTTEVWRIGG